MATRPLPATAHRANYLPTLIGAGALLAGVLATNLAYAARCQADGAGKTICTYQERTHSFNAKGLFGCSGAKKTRSVRWQVPEGTPPEGGWPVVFYFQGTVPASEAGAKPFTITSNAFGGLHFQAALRELLDDPNGTGRKYAVIAPEASPKFGMRYWDTNVPGSYSLKEDACFFPDLFKEVASGAYGPPSQFNMGKRFAFGISSGGYNTSRMAASFNDGSSWSALAIVAGSYATCAGPLCSIPRTLPANHPPTRFYHGTADVIVGISTMRPYFEKLRNQGIEVDKVEHGGGHEFTADVLGAQGIKAWFDRF